MTVKEYLEKQGKFDNITFIIERAKKSESTPFYEEVYSRTPIRTVEQWLKWVENDNYIVINADHAPIDVTGNWTRWYNENHLKCAIITTPEELIKHYGEGQGKEMVEYYNRTVK